jgi:TatD DNase family protein
MVPADKLLIETDSPYLAPEPVRGTRNDSSNLKYIVEKIAEFKETSPEKIAKMTYENAEKLFIK